MRSIEKNFETIALFFGERAPRKNHPRSADPRCDTAVKGTGKPITRRKAEISVQAFVQSVHRFAEEHYQEDDPVPPIA